MAFRKEPGISGMQTEHFSRLPILWEEKEKEKSTVTRKTENPLRASVYTTGRSTEFAKTIIPRGNWVQKKHIATAICGGPLKNTIRMENSARWEPGTTALWWEITPCTTVSTTPI